MSSSSSTGRCWNYDVFLNFRGTDTRNNFISHLYQALINKGVNAFIDYKLERGEEISLSLLKVIEGSRISVVVFSEDYASSTCCLDELVKIMECRESKGQKVLPVFYKVNPANVQLQTGEFGEAFVKQEANFAGDLEKPKTWRLALENAAEFGGWHLDKGNEATLIKCIVDKILMKLSRTILHVAEHPIGLDSRIKDLDHELRIGSNDVDMIGIIGIGGIGKTTVAKALFNTIANQFESSCFLENVREISKNHGIGYLQETLLLEIFGDERKLMGNPHKGVAEMKYRLRSKRVLIVIDDADNVDQLKNLAGGIDWFGKGSRIIITTRDKRLLDAHRVKTKYEIKELCNDDALHLFSWNAFREPQPIEGYANLSKRAVEYAKGLPLALVVLGSLLYNRNIPEWENELDNLERKPNRKIHEILKTSYDSLEENEQDIFLDIACFFRGMDKDYVMRVLDACDLKPFIGVQVLIEKCLITIENNKLQMHDLVQSMGRQVVNELSSTPSKRSRIWFHEDVIDVLEENTGASEIEGMMIDLPADEDTNFHPEAFSRMKSLKILIVRNAKFTKAPINLPNKLRWLEWPGFPLQAIPSSFHARKLVGLDIRNGRVRQLGEIFKNCKYLKFLDLRNCDFLENTPDFSTTPNLEILNLESCANLVAVHQSVGCLDKLKFLSLEFCYNLESLPSSFRLRSLQTLLLTDCKKLKVFPEIVEKMACLQKACLSRTGLEVLPSSIENFTELKVFNLNFCQSLSDLPASIYKLRHLKHLFLEGCSKLRHFPLTEKNSIDLNCTLSPPIDAFGSLESCSSIGLPALRFLDLKNCNLFNVSFLMVPNYFPVLKDLDLSGNSVETLPRSISCLSKLRSLKLSNCVKLREIPNLPPNVKRVEARDCKLLEIYTQLCRVFRSYGPRPNRICYIDLSNCHKLAQIEKIFPNALSKGSGATSLWNMEVFRRDSSIELLLPGSEIPEWFTYVGECDSLDFYLSPDEAKKTIALVFCAILSLDLGEETSKNISCEVLINGQNMILLSRQFLSLETDHMWLYYFPCFSTSDLQIQCEVHFKVLGAKMGSSLRNCGVHRVCKEDEMGLPYNDPYEGMYAENLYESAQTDSSSINLQRSRPGDNNDEVALSLWAGDNNDPHEGMHAENLSESVQTDSSSINLQRSGQGDNNDEVALTLWPKDLSFGGTIDTSQLIRPSNRQIDRKRMTERQRDKRGGGRDGPIFHATIDNRNSLSMPINLSAIEEKGKQPTSSTGSFQLSKT